MKRLLVLGFYDRGNLGDEMFRETLPLLVPDFNCTFIPTDCCEELIDSYDGIICGAGDIFNEYFMTTIEKIIENVSKKPIYIVGMGVPYVSMFKSHYLSLFDHVFLRETTDLFQLTQQIGGRYAHALPDLAFLKTPLTWFPTKKRIIGVFLAQPMRAHENYINSMIDLLTHVSKFGNLKFIRFNYSENPEEDDKYIQNDIQKILEDKGIFVDNDLSIYTTDQILEMLTRFQFAICGRFHAHIYATIAGCPFISVAFTRKTELFMKEENLDLSLNTGDYISQFDKVWKQRNSYSKKLQSISRRNHERLQTKQINNLLLQKSRRCKNVNQVNQKSIFQSTKNLLFKLIGYTGENLDQINIAKISESIASKVAAYMCFEITKTPGSSYEWGAAQNIMTKPWELQEMINWIIDDLNGKKIKEFPRLDLDFYDQNDLNGLHRAGWQYVLTYLRILNNNRGVLCDTFIDRSFLWGRWSLSQTGIIPYTGVWIGFVHHTPNREYDNNCWEMIKSIEFVQSLPTCRGIICLSEYLSQWFRDRFQEIKVNVPVITLFHPTLFINKRWDSSKVDWDNLKLINVGAWYRNPFAIYQIDTPSYIKKMVLKGSKMEDYILPESLSLTKSQILNPDHTNICVYYLCLYIQEIADWSKLSFNFTLSLENEPSHPELLKLYNLIREKISSVNIIEKLENNQYDELLNSSLVFLNLIDASAVNTVIECIVRETPILVNRHPALEEYLGKDYPLFYDELTQASSLLQYDQILKANEYLKNKDKDFLKIDNFLSELIQTDLYQSLGET
jgi:polysaccharide pyruvyl transferase WcaK-like protein